MKDALAFGLVVFITSFAIVFVPIAPAVWYFEGDFAILFFVAWGWASFWSILATLQEFK